MIDRPIARMNQVVGAAKGLRLLISDQTRCEPRLVELSQPFAVVGRAPKADIALAGPDVSFRHAYLQVLDGRVFCVDLGSRTGVLWGNEPRASGWLPYGGSVRIGSYTLQVLDNAQSAVFSTDEALLNPLEDGLGEAIAYPQFELEFYDESFPDVVRAIDRRITLIGRGAPCAVCVDDLSVSRVHCALVLTSDGLWLVDLLGKDGTRLNRQQVHCGFLENGSELVIGMYLISVWRRESHPRETANVPSKLGAGPHV
jgi:pSer/pThr/pTyr-binding forkhead associated (FHA) protein